MSSSESTPFLDHEHGDLEARPSKVGQGYHGMKLKVSFDNPTRREIRRFFSSLYGHYLVLILVSIDVGCIFADFLMSLYICDHSGDKSNSVSEDLPYVQDALQVIGIVFSCLFMVELLASIWAFGLSYFNSKFHCFDAVIVIAGFIVDVCLSNVLEEAASIIVIMRLWRVFKIIEEFSAEASDQMSILSQKIENLKAENHKLKREMRAWIDDNGE